MCFIKHCVVLLLICLLALENACVSTSIETARANFYANRLNEANENLKEIPLEDKDTVLYLMERGMIKHVLGDYEGSSSDWRKAAEIEKILETYSLSEGVSSWIVNDKTYSFTGFPFEHTLLYTFLAKNYLAQSNWDYAAICARNIISLLEKRGPFPDIPYSSCLLYTSPSPRDS